VVLISLNFFYMFFKCFMRTISIITEEEGDKDILDSAHEYRFFLFSIMDVLNGLSILYSFYCMARTDENRRRSGRHGLVLS
jgi:hypothetical protein